MRTLDPEFSLCHHVLLGGSSVAGQKVVDAGCRANPKLRWLTLDPAQNVNVPLSQSRPAAALRSRVHHFVFEATWPCACF